MTQPAEVTSRSLPSPMELTIKSSGKLVGFACPKCGQLFLIRKDDTSIEVAGRADEAAAHCVKECICGKTLDYHYRLRCADCRGKQAKQAEQQRLENATKLLLEDYSGPVYWEGHVGGLGEGYFSGTDEVLDYCEDEGCPVPEYVWACKAHEFTLDSERFLEEELERQELYEGAAEDIAVDAKERLQAYLNVWTKEQKLVGWRYDYTRAILLRSPASGPVLAK